VVLGVQAHVRVLRCDLEAREQDDQDEDEANLTNSDFRPTKKINLTNPSKLE
jgi:uncharacterized protein YjbI with pentapeptide repeats